MSIEGVLVWAAIVLGQLAAAGWVLVRRRGMRPVLMVNLLCAIAVLCFVVPYLPGEIGFIGEGEASELFDYKNTILTAFEAVTLIGSAFAWWGALWGKIIAWIGFAGNCMLSLVAALFFMTFKFKCCGYL
ncbi:MAG TPA: hypothetical protein VFQ90_08450 [Stellaceae bacterium]|jgi:hypothetical protein|nr:hypothetical protein [Stellaceae bacterium]